jgi:3-dehydroquinate dehydratase I
MTNTVRIGDVELGSGRPAVCVPLTGSTAAELRAEAALVTADVADLVELRIDHLDALDDEASLDGADGWAGDVVDAVVAVRTALPSTLPILFTFRSAAEGGQRSLAPDALVALVEAALGTGAVDAVDVEQFADADARDRIVRRAHDAGIPVVMSSHDFTATPARDEIVARLVAQEDLGADVVKLACMPQSPADVVTLLAATEEYARAHGEAPAITMAMGPLGVVSRLGGETFGSTLTFGTVGAASAPGQVEARALRAVLDLVHDAQH